MKLYMFCKQIQNHIYLSEFGKLKFSFICSPVATQIKECPVYHGVIIPFSLFSDIEGMKNLYKFSKADTKPLLIAEVYSLKEYSFESLDERIDRNVEFLNIEEEYMKFHNPWSFVNYWKRMTRAKNTFGSHDKIFSDGMLLSEKIIFNKILS